jgi:hypothetical protein
VVLREMQCFWSAGRRAVLFTSTQLHVHGFTEYAIALSKPMWLHGSGEAIYATFHNFAAGGGRSTLNISAVRDQSGWRCHHLEALAPALSLWSGAGAGSR